MMPSLASGLNSPQHASYIAAKFSVTSLNSITRFGQKIYHGSPEGNEYLPSQ